MKHLFVLALLAGCAVDEDPDLSTETSEITGVWFGYDCEAGSIIGGTRVTDHVTASHGAYIAFDAGGSARFFRGIGAPAYFYGWARVMVPASGGGLSVQFDSDPPAVYALLASSTWMWIPIGGHELQVGTRQIKLTATTAGLLVDRILFVQASSFIPITDVYEAEAGSLVFPMTIGTQRLPATTKYVSVPNGSGDYAGRVDLDVAVPYDTTYILWARANAPSTADNSFRVGRDGSANGFAWDAAVTSTMGWTWNRPTVAQRIDITDVLSIASVDDGAKRDKLLITNDPGFLPIESSPPLVIAM